MSMRNSPSRSMQLPAVSKVSIVPHSAMTPFAEAACQPPILRCVRSFHPKQLQNTLQPQSVLTADMVPLQPPSVTLPPPSAPLQPPSVTLPLPSAPLQPPSVTLPPPSVTLPPPSVTLQPPSVTHQPSLVPDSPRLLLLSRLRDIKALHCSAKVPAAATFGGRQRTACQGTFIRN